MMVVQKIVLNIDRDEVINPQKRIEIKGLTCVNSDGINSLDNVSLVANSGEVLGIAGIAGSGQKELLEAIAGIQEIKSGSIIYTSSEGKDINITNMNSDDIQKNEIKISFVPEDRLGMGLVSSMDLTDNMMLKNYKNNPWYFVPRKKAKELALSIITPSAETPVGRLSGGNVQKVLVGREINSNPRVLMLAYPVRGLDINSSYTIYNLINEQKKKGVAVICVIEDLDILLELCDRIVVLNKGKVAAILDARTTNKEEVGLLMTKSGKESEENEQKLTTCK